MTEALSNLPAESAILGAILLEGASTYHRVSEYIKPDHFYDSRNVSILAAIKKLVDNGEGADSVSVMAELRKSDSTVDPVYLMDLTSSVAGSANITTHAKVIRECHMRRTAMLAAREIMERATDPKADPFELCENGSMKLLEAVQIRSSNTLKYDAIHQMTIKHLEDIANSPDGIVGVSGTVDSLASWLNGYQGGKLYIFAARTAMGKSALAIVEAKGIALNGDEVLFESLEMGHVENGQRILTNHTEIYADKIMRGDLSAHDWEIINAKGGDIANMPLWIDVSGRLSIGELRSRVAMHKQKYGLRALVVDYLQLMQGTGGNREQEIASISRGLKSIAVDYDIPVIALSQLSRKVEDRGGAKKPQLSDLRESGAIENDADVVVMLYRPEYYGIDRFEDGTSTEGVCQIIIAKQRGGKTGEFNVLFEPDRQRWKELEAQTPESDQSYF